MTMLMMATLAMAMMMTVEIQAHATSHWFQTLLLQDLWTGDDTSDFGSGKLQIWQTVLLDCKKQGF